MRPDVTFDQLAHLLADDAEFERLLTVYDALHELVLRPGLKITNAENAALGMSAVATGLGVAAHEPDARPRRAAVQILIAEWTFSRHFDLIVPAQISGVPILIEVAPPGRPGDGGEEPGSP